jgi:hypothetical protein
VVAGVVVHGPMLPVDPGASVSWPAVRAVVTVFRVGSQTPLRTVGTGQDGRFAVALAPGTYRLHPEPAGSSTLPISHDLRVRVRAGKKTQVRLWLDTGVRFAAAQGVKPGTPPPGDQRYPQGLEGTTQRGPITPVSRPGVPNTAPCAATLIVYRYNGTQVATIPSTAQAGFAQSLPAGRFIVEPHSGVSAFDRAGPFSIRVPKDQWLSLVVDFDTGIR